jgi:DNA polymerase V
MSVLSRFTPDLEIYSIDEAFLGLQGFGARLETHARALRAAVLQDGGRALMTRYRRHRPDTFFRCQ